MGENRNFEEYSRNYSIRICEQAFSDKTFISGEDILHLTDIKQVNLFIIKNLLLDWKNELKKLNSPYFDFQHEEVRHSLKQFGNTLSRHIKLQRADCQALLAESTKETLLLIFQPYDYFMEIIVFGEKNNHLLADFKEYTRYIKINRNVLDLFLKKMEIQGYHSITSGVKVLDEVFGEVSTQPEDLTEYVDKFNKTVPLDPEKLYHSALPVAEASIPAPNDLPAKEKTNLSTTQPVGAESKSIPDKENQIKTLNDAFSDEKRQTIADMHQRQKIESIKKSLTLNQKFMFINNLFEGNAQHFEETIDQLENFTSKQEALSFISRHFQWNIDQEETIEFMELVDKRFN
ncbi:MAG: hypothetical protein OEX02_16945 [Cyclobacteriaceae bacterium]|nr:hypothetical protein [Cyclobacteriaceae bacterium]